MYKLCYLCLSIYSLNPLVSSDYYQFALLPCAEIEEPLQFAGTMSKGTRSLCVSARAAGRDPARSGTGLGMGSLLSLKQARRNTEVA